MKRLLILVSFLGISLSSFAQGFGGGLFAGISTSQMLGDNIGGFHKAGFYGGAFTDFRFTPRSALQLEMSFLQRGSKQTPTVKNNNTSLFFNLNYIEFPVLYRWYGIKNMNLEIGPSVSYLISSRQEDTFGEITNKIDFNDIDLSLAAGLSYYLLKNKKLEVNARYSISLIPPSTDAGRYWQHHVIAFSIRYWFKTTINQATEAIANNKVKVNINLKEEE
ncbi:MAG: hypothetical protein ACI9FU_002181 [Granulosicoccus sp.]|jgi:hypothetical protein